MLEERVKERTDRRRESTHDEQQNKKIGGKEEQKGKKETYGATLTQPSIRVMRIPKRGARRNRRYRGGPLTPKAPQLP